MYDIEHMLTTRSLNLFVRCQKQEKQDFITKI